MVKTDNGLVRQGRSKCYWILVPIGQEVGVVPDINKFVHSNS